MNQLNVHLLHLPDEILLIILKKLNNIDVLYSLLNIDNERLSILAQEKIFSNTLKFVSIDNISSIDHHKIDRFYIDILPRIHHNVKCFILEPVLMECILLAADYPNLTELKLFNFEQKIALNYFTNESPLRHIFQQQITELILGNRDRNDMIGSSKKYTTNVYGHILKFFKNLKHLTIIETFNPSYPRLSLHKLPPTTFSSSTLTHLCINMYTLDDCLYLLDGRLKQLSSLIIGISYVDEFSSIVHNMDNLPNLKYFSLKCYVQINQYDNKILPLLHHRARFIDKTHLQNEILIYMPRLHSFTFYISTDHNTVDLFHDVPRQDNQRIVTNIGQQSMANIIHYTSINKAVYHIFSLPFVFDHLEDIGNIFTDTIFNYVTYLLVQDIFPFNHEFFIRIARSFPLLNNLRIVNFQSQSTCNLNTFSSDSSQSYSIAEYPYLTSLDVRTAAIDYAEQFLNETKTYAPYLTELTIHYRNLKMVTNDFTREETRRSCAKVKRLIMIGTWVHSKDFYLYFPLL
ncbi:unnamed protein product [Rotaria sp. Silwood2]|nr:unnamed protein product [Rotaria sp. Silwood2]CAF4417146.1 unnamed protein product [Rotaria sp. Silwood2]